jgi:pimeloyl-ACP methyl ester carboxylesterase
MSANRKINHDEMGPGLRIAYLVDGPKDSHRCGFFWLGGFKSDMTGTKAEALAKLARETQRPCLRFDYSGHGASTGAFTEGTISGWLDQSLQMFRRHAQGPRIIVGSSMGGWLAMLLHRTLGAEAIRVKGLVLIAPAADMTTALMWDTFTPEARNAIENEGLWLRPSAYGDGPYPNTRKLIEDGRKHLLLGNRLTVDCPVRILQGAADIDVPPAHGMRIFEAIAGEDVMLTLIQGGGHRLSTARDIELLKRTAGEFAQRGDE